MFVNSSIETIRETFLRINTQGMKITTADAIFSRAENLKLRDIVREIQGGFRNSFGRIDEAPILFALAAVSTQTLTELRGEALKRIIHRIEIKAQDDKRLLRTLTKKWDRLRISFGRAVDYLRGEFCVLNIDYLYSPYIVTMLALFFHLNSGRGPSRHQKEQIRRWFWATCVGGRYTGRDFNRCIPQDLTYFRKLAAGSAKRFRVAPQTETVDIRKAQYTSKTGIASAFYCLLLKRKPVSIMDKALNEIPLEEFSTQANRKDRHHIFPKAQLNSKGIDHKLTNSICNICLLSAAENQEISFRRPSSYLEEAWAEGRFFGRKMHRHLIPVDDDSGIWSRNMKAGFKRFLKDRTELIRKELEKEAGIKLFRRDLV